MPHRTNRRPAAAQHPRPPTLSDPATPALSAATPQLHTVQPGLVLLWGETGAPPVPASADDAVLFRFCPETSAGRDGWMDVCRPASEPPTALPAGAFAVGLLVSGPPLRDLLADDRTPGVAHVRAVLREGAAPAPQPLSPALRLAVESIRRCPFWGPCRQWALAARAHDLLVEFLAQRPPEASPPGVDARLRRAAGLLEKDLANPPSLAELARHAGLSETSLKRGFRRAFGDTVFGHLRTLRMTRARALLESGECTVLEAATRVGFSNPSNFAAAFRRQFGLNPKQFQLAARR